MVEARYATSATQVMRLCERILQRCCRPVQTMMLSSVPDSGAVIGSYFTVAGIGSNNLPFVNQQSARDFAVKQRQLFIRLHVEVPGQSWIAGKHTDFPARTALSKDLTQSPIERLEILLLA